MADNLPSFAPRNFEEARAFAQFIANTNFVPEAFRNKPDEVLACIQYGSEVGLSPMQSLQNITVINGRPSMWGDVMLALVQQSGRMEYINETETVDEAVCEVKRTGDPHPRVVRWSVKDTQTAGLAAKPVHQGYPKRMRQMRARGFALRDKFPDVLKGLIAREEAIDITPASEFEPPPITVITGDLTKDETPRAKELKLQPEQIQKGAPRVSAATDGESSVPAAESAPKGGGDVQSAHRGEMDNVGAASSYASGSPENGEGSNVPLSDSEQRMAKLLFSTAKGPASAKMAVLRQAIPGYTDVNNLKKEQVAAFTAALQKMQ